MTRWLAFALVMLALGCSAAKFTEEQTECLAQAELDSAARFARTCGVTAAKCEALYQKAQSAGGSPEFESHRQAVLECAAEYRNCLNERKKDDEKQEEACLQD